MSVATSFHRRMKEWTYTQNGTLTGWTQKEVNQSRMWRFNQAPFSKRYSERYSQVKDNPVMALQFHHVNAKIPQDILGVHTYLLVREHFPQANLDVIVRDIARVMMFSLQAPKVHNLWYMVPQLYAEDWRLRPTLWTNNLGSSVPCDGPLDTLAHGQARYE